MDEEAIGRAMDGMRTAVAGRDHAVVLAAYSSVDDVPRWRPHAQQVIRHALCTIVVRPDGGLDPFPGESCLVVMTPDHAAALCQGPGTVVTLTEDRDVVTAIGRVRLQRRTERVG